MRLLSLALFLLSLSLATSVVIDSSTCGSHGQAMQQLDWYVCVCDKGYKGVNCDTQVVLAPVCNLVCAPQQLCVVDSQGSPSCQPSNPPPPFDPTCTLDCSMYTASHCEHTAGDDQCVENKDLCLLQCPVGYHCDTVSSVPGCYPDSCLVPPPQPEQPAEEQDQSRQMTKLKVRIQKRKL